VFLGNAARARRCGRELVECPKLADLGRIRPPVLARGQRPESTRVQPFACAKPVPRDDNPQEHPILVEQHRAKRNRRGARSSSGTRVYVPRPAGHGYLQLGVEEGSRTRRCRPSTRSRFEAHVRPAPTRSRRPARRRYSVTSAATSPPHYSALELAKGDRVRGADLRGAAQYGVAPRKSRKSPATTSPAKCDGRERTPTLLMNGEILVEQMGVEPTTSALRKPL
jgi:hypothetical protein